jgi:hypothetical protein
LFLATALGCGNSTEDAQGALDAAAKTANTPQQSTESAPADHWEGKIVETMDSGGYTYLLLDTGEERVWVAGPETPVAMGQRVTLPQGMLMADFHSKTLDRDFAELYFVGAIYPEGKWREGSPKGHGDLGGRPAGHMDGSIRTSVDKVEVAGIAKAAGGYTIAEIYGRRAELKDQAVKVRGKVVKFSPRIMGTNWVHIQDGSGEGPDSDLTLTTDASVAEGDLVLIEGPLSVDRDFGSGYRYDVIVEGATVTLE